MRASIFAPTVAARKLAKGSPLDPTHLLTDTDLTPSDLPSAKAMYRNDEVADFLKCSRRHVDLLAALNPRPNIFLAYDEDRDLEPLRVACRMLIEAGWTAASHRLRAYVLCGYPGDTQAAAEGRMRTAVAAGVTPMAMVYRGKDGVEAEGWHAWARQWIRPACMHKREGR
jgi:hypothetical protein